MNNGLHFATYKYTLSTGIDFASMILMVFEVKTIQIRLANYFLLPYDHKNIGA